MTHGATINILNSSNYNMNLADVGRICHGKYTDLPPKAIASKGGTGKFRVSPKEGESIGPKGWLVYNMVVNNKPEVIRIFWDHPVGSGKTRYEISSEPYAIEWKLEGKTTGTEQTITLTFMSVKLEIPSSISTIGCDH